MRKYLKQLVLVCGLAGLLTSFNNCGNYAEPYAQNMASLANLDCDQDCVTPTLQNLEIKPHLGGNGTEFSVPANLLEFNVGGDCNEGGYPYNLIKWELFLNGNKMRDSGMSGMAGASSVHSVCVNGRFLVYVNLKSITNDPVNRVGLTYGGPNRSPYDLYIEIFGKKSLNDPAPASNSTKGRFKVSLLPI